MNCCIKKSVAICIPTYNNVSALEKLLSSITIQNYTDFFVVVSDDSTNQQVEMLVRSYVKKICIVYNKNAIPLGPTKNTNNAIMIAKKYFPKYIKVMHHDDYFSFAYSLSKFVDLLESDIDADVAFCGTIQIARNKTYTRHISENELEKLKDDFRILSIGNYIGAPSATVMRNTDILMNEKLKWEVDIDWYMRILHRNHNFVCTKEPLVTICMGESNVTNFCINDKELVMREKIEVFKSNVFLHTESFMQNLILEMEKYLGFQEFRKFISDKNSEFYIYGAGVIGRRCLEFIEKSDVNVLGFIVSDISDNPSIIMGKKVFSLDTVSNIDKLKIIVAVSKKYESDVIAAIKNKCIADNKYKCYKE